MQFVRTRVESLFLEVTGPAENKFLAKSCLNELPFVPTLHNNTVRRDARYSRHSTYVGAGRRGRIVLCNTQCDVDMSRCTHCVTKGAGPINLPYAVNRAFCITLHGIAGFLIAK